MRISTFFLALAPFACAASPARPLHLERVVLFQNGIGHFERAGVVPSNRLRLLVKPDEVDDVIKTLTVIDEAGGAQQVAAVLPAASPTPNAPVAVDVVLSRPGRRLRVSYAVPTATWKTTYRVALPEKPGGPALLQAWALVDNLSPEPWRDVQLTLATGASLSFATDLRTPRFVPRPDASDVLTPPTATAPVVAEHAQAGDRDRDGIADADDDKCSDEPETFNGFEDADGCPDRGRVVVTSNHIEILERIRFAPGSAALAAGAAAILDATADMLRHNPDIIRVIIEGHAAAGELDPLSLSARRAAAVRAALIERGVEQVLELEASGASRPLGSAPERNRRVEFLIASRREAAPPAPGLTASALDRSTRTSSRTIEVAGSTRYQLGDRVTLPRGASTLVSVLSRSIPGEDVLLFRPDPQVPGSDLHPLRAARVVVPSGLGLEPGPVAVFAGGGFAGEGLLPRTPGGDVSYIPYALDGATIVRASDTSDERPRRLISLSRGVATVENQIVRRTTYTIRTGARPAARIFLRHLPSDGFALRELPAGSERGERAVLIPVPLVAHRESTLIIEEYQPVERRLAIVDDEGARLGLYLEGADLPAPLLARVRTVVAARAALGTVEGELEGLHERLADAAQRADELQRSLTSVAKLPGGDAAALRRRLIASLGAASARTDALSVQLAAARAREVDLRVKVQTALEGIVLDAPAAP